MPESKITKCFLEKLDNSNEEIRERNLLRLISKLDSGVSFDNDFQRTKELLIYLINWLRRDDTYQAQVLELIFKSIKSKVGKEIIKVINGNDFLNELESIQYRIQSKCKTIYKSIIRYIQECCESTDIQIPVLDMPLSAESNKYEISPGSLETNAQCGIKHVSNLHSFVELNNGSKFDITQCGVKIFLMPWCHLNEPDINKIKSNEECMNTVGSEEKAIYFFNNILSKDFPAEVFLNRPSILLHMLKLVNDEKLSICTMESILSYCSLLHKRINEICDPSRSCKKITLLNEDHDLQSRSQFTENSLNDMILIKNSISTLKQLPLPYFCFDCMYNLINVIGQNVMMKTQNTSRNSNIVREFNLTSTIINKLFVILKKVVKNTVWKAERSNRFVEELIQKLILLFHLCGDVLNKLRILCLVNDNTEPQYRTTYLRLLIFCVDLTSWCNYHAFMPHNFISSLCDSICDASFSNSYPRTHRIMLEILKNLIENDGSMEEKNKFKQFLNVENIALGMRSSIEIFLSLENSLKSPNIIYKFKSSLQALEYHKNTNIISIILDTFSSKLNKWLLTDDHWKTVKTTMLELLAHNCVWVKCATYSKVFYLVNKFLNGSIKSKSEDDVECLRFLFVPAIFVEICSYGLESDCDEIKKFACDIIQHLLRGKLLMSDQLWKMFLDAFLPALPLLHVRSTYEDEFGKAILKTLELNVGEYMLIPRIEIVKGNIRLLYSKNLSTKMSGSYNLLKLIYASEEAENMLPKQESVIPDLLCSTMQSFKEKNFNVNKPGDKDFYEKGALLQVMNILKENMPRTDDNYLSDQLKTPIIDPLVCKSALSQLAVILQQTNLHSAFLKNKGQEIIVYYMKTSLLIDEFTTFPESIMSCIAILNSICYSNTNIRQWMSEQQNIIFYIIRAILLFPNEEYFISNASQLLCLLIFSHFIINSNNFSNGDSDIYNLSMHSSIINKINLPFKCSAYAKVSPHQNHNTEALIMEQPALSNYLRIHWCANWYGGFDKVVKWPYVPDYSIDEDFNNALKINDNDLYLMKMTCPIQGCVTALYEIQNATSHKSVNKAINMLEGYIHLGHEGKCDMNEFIVLPWCNTLKRFLVTPPASPNDAELLLNFIRFIEILLQTFHNNPKCVQIFSGLVKPVMECSNSIVAIYKNEDFNPNADLASIKLNGQICQLIAYCCTLTNLPFYEKISDFEANWTPALNHLIDCLGRIHINNVTALVYTDQLIGCLIHLTAFYCNNCQENQMNENLFSLSKTLINLCDTLYSKKNYMEYKGYSLLLNSMIILCHVLEIVLCNDEETERFRSILVGNSRNNLLNFCLMHYDSQHVWIRGASLKLLSGLVSSSFLFSYLDKYDNILFKIMKIAIDMLCDFNEASFIREQAAVMIRNVLNSLSKQKNADTQNELGMLFNSIFFENMIVTFTKICVAEEHLPSIGENISLTYLSKKEYCEVAFSKTGINEIPMKSVQFMPAKCTVQLVAVIADVIYNLLQVYDNIIEELGQSEIFKIIFRCILLDIPNTEIKLKMCSSVCRLLYKASNQSDEILTMLVDTRNCVNGLLKLFALDEELNSIETVAYINTQKWCFLLLGSLFKTSYGFNSIWNLISEGGISLFFYCISTAISDKIYHEIIPSVLYCFSCLLHSYTSNEINNDHLNLEYFLDKEIATRSLDAINKIDNDEENKITMSQIHSGNTVFENENSVNRNKLTIIFGEELCFHLIQLYRIGNKNSVKKRMQTPHFDKIASSLSNLFGISHKAKYLAIENGFLEEIIQNLNEIQYFLVTTNDSMNLIRNNDKSPVLQYLNWTLLLVGNIISNCNKAKEISTEYNLSSYINKLWPWIISSGLLRFYTIQMLCSYTNSNLRACQSMCTATIGRSLLSEVIELVMKEMNIVTRKHALETLSGCLQILQNVCLHLHCRSIIIKSDIFLSLNKLHPAITKRQPHWRKVEIIWEDFLNTITRYPEGQIKVGEYLGIVCALIHQADGLMFEVLRNCAFNPFNRPRFFGSAEIMLLFSKTLSSPSAIFHKMSVCSALWALCANSQKSKLSIKSAGLHAKLSDCIQTMSASDEYERETQIASYVLKIINSP